MYQGQYESVMPQRPQHASASQQRPHTDHELLRNLPCPTIRTQGNVREYPFGHACQVVAIRSARPRFHVDRHARVSDADNRAVATHFVSDKDRKLEGHLRDRHRRYAPVRASTGETRARDIHLPKEPPAKDVSCRICISRKRKGAQHEFAVGG